MSIDPNHKLYAKLGDQVNKETYQSSLAGSLSTYAIQDMAFHTQWVLWAGTCIVQEVGISMFVSDTIIYKE
jgi:hypothetical protein